MVVTIAVEANVWLFVAPDPPPVSARVPPESDRPELAEMMLVALAGVMALLKSRVSVPPLFTAVVPV